MDPQPSAGVTFQSVPLTTPVGRRELLVATFAEDRVVGAELLERLRQPQPATPIEDSLIGTAGRTPGRHVLMVIRGRSADGGRCWRFDDELAEADQRELAERLIRSHLPTYRKLAAVGIRAIVHTDFRDYDGGLMRQASATLLERRLRGKEGRDLPSEVQAADRWALEHMAYWFSVSYELAIKHLIPDAVATAERHAPPSPTPPRPEPSPTV